MAKRFFFAIDFLLDVLGLRCVGFHSITSFREVGERVARLADRHPRRPAGREPSPLRPARKRGMRETYGRKNTAKQAVVVLPWNLRAAKPGPCCFRDVCRLAHQKEN
ncbi:hypothetical protein AU374_01439 [Cupriavidus metallidurans]|nr:hypothetical protein AU374_01439 [Cupriavidus metallidurans]